MIPPSAAVGPRPFRRGGAIALVLRSTRRRWWRSWAALAALVAAVGGFTLSATAAGRRTSSAYPGFVSRYGFDVAAFTDRAVPGLTRFPEVATAVLALNPLAGSPTCRCRSSIPASDFTVLTPPAGGRLPLKLLRGRLPDPRHPDEALISQSTQQELGLGLGSQVTIPFYGASQGSVLGGDAPPPAPRGPVVRFDIVGIEISEGEFPAGSSPSYNLYAGDAFAARYQDLTANAYLYLIRLRAGRSSLANFERDANNLSSQGFLGYLSADSDNQAVQSSIHPQAMGWWALAVLAALAGLAVLGQALARQGKAESVDYPTLASLGVTRSQLLWVQTLRNAVVGATGAGGALAIAYLVSPLTPVGEARLAETHTGFNLDATVLLPGALAVAVAAMAVGLVPSLMSTRHPSRTGEADALETSPVVERLAAMGLPPSVIVGIRHALVGGRGRDSVPVRTALLGTVLAVTALCGTEVFNASLQHLTANPRLYGDLYQLNFNTGGQPDPGLLQRLSHDRQVTAVNQGFSAQLSIGSYELGGAAVGSIRGGVLVATRSGRLAKGPAEIDLGAVSLRRVAAHVGSTVAVSFARPQGGTATARMRVVGVVVLPVLGNTVDLGTGAYITPAAYVAAVCSAPAPPGCDDRVRANTDGGLLASFADTSAGRTDLRRYEADYPSIATEPTAPTGLVNFGQAVSFPLIFGLLVSLFGAATLVHMLVTSVSRRRREAGLLKALGFLNRQVAAVVGWQATTTAVIGLAFGLPLGAALGRLVWSAFAANIGVVTVVRVPGWSLVVLGLGALLMADALALPAALAAARRSAVRLLAQR